MRDYVCDYALVIAYIYVRVCVYVYIYIYYISQKKGNRSLGLIGGTGDKQNLTKPSKKLRFLSRVLHISPLPVPVFAHSSPFTLLFSHSRLKRTNQHFRTQVHELHRTVIT